MKNQIKKLTLFVFVAAAFFTSCKKDDNSSSSSSNTTTALNSNAQQGKWRVTLYNDSGNDETNHYTGYDFQFNSGGTLIATNAGSSVNGTWTSGTDDSQVKLILNFGSAVPFSELSSDWHVTQQSSLIIKLEDVSGGGSGTDYLTFEKI